jgi:hypothetical protein
MERESGPSVAMVGCARVCEAAILAAWLQAVFYRLRCLEDSASLVTTRQAGEPHCTS